MEEFYDWRQLRYMDCALNRTMENSYNVCLSQCEKLDFNVAACKEECFDNIQGRRRHINHAAN